MTNETEKLIKDALELTGTRYELEAGYKHRLLSELAHALRRAESARDAALKQAAAWEIQAQDLRDRLVRAEAERDAQHDLVLRLTAERDEAKADAVRMLTAASQPGITSARLAADLDEARAQVWGLICVATNCAIKADKGFPALRQVLDRCPSLQRDELTATRDLLIDENARLQKEHNAYVQRLKSLKRAWQRMLSSGNRDMVCAAEHDEFWLGINVDQLAEVITSEQCIELQRCGVRYDEGTDSLAVFT